MEGNYTDCNDLRLKGARYIPLRTTPQLESKGPLGVINHQMACGTPVGKKSALCTATPQNTSGRVTVVNRILYRAVLCSTPRGTADAQQRGFRSVENATNTYATNRTRYNQAMCAKLQTQLQ